MTSQNLIEIRRYYLCVSGELHQRRCAPGLWWDINENWCVGPNDVTCYEGTQITPPPQTTTPSSTLPPNTAICSDQRDFFDGQTYLKTMCLVRSAGNYDNGRLQCHNNNMNLLIIDSSVVQILFFNATMEILFPSFPNGHVWINGRRSTSWTVQNSDDTVRGPLYANMDWAPNGETNGPCLLYSGAHSNRYQPIGNACTTNGWFVCEHGAALSSTPAITTTTTSQTTPPTTTSTTTSTPTTTTSTQVSTAPPNTSICFRSRDLFNGQTYLKTMCLINSNSNYNNARNICSTNNMNLFIINDAVTYRLFFNASMEVLYTSWPNGHVWINGRYNGVEWTVQNHDDSFRGYLYSNLDWLNGVSTAANGSCLLYTAQNGTRYQPTGVSCNMGSWLVCEHEEQSTTPDPTATPVQTTPGSSNPNLSVCRHTEDLYDNGVYMKSHCIVSSSQSYAEAESFCRANGMELFVIASSAMQIQFRSSVTRLLAGAPRGFLWINGRYEDPHWFVFDPNRRYMWGGIDWVQTGSINGRESGECLRYTAEHSTNEPVWQSRGNDCTHQSWFTCEYFL